MYTLKPDACFKNIATKRLNFFQNSPVTNLKYFLIYSYILKAPAMTSN